MKKFNIKSKANGLEKLLAIFTVIIFFSISLTGCGGPSSAKSEKTIQAVGAENEYADVIKQIGGEYVSVTSIMNNLSADPHSYESNTKDANAVSKAELIVQNGIGYDDFMNKLESGSSNSKRTVIDVGKSLGYSKNTPNPHLWYDPKVMPKVAKLIAENLEKQNPDQKKYFEDRLTKFNNSMKGYTDVLNEIKKNYSKAGVAVTEPVADYMLNAAGVDTKTPWTFQTAVMNGTDPSPQDVKMQQDLLKNKKVKVFLYNQQAVDDAAKNQLKIARANKVPVVGVYETMPPKHNYQTWMEDEAKNLLKALKNGVSTEKMS
ncbi:MULTISPECIES: metal ABC transporter solute-binding protein, Zn/Mn family [Clostridium]|jgi:zinc/manganese transport system substrate-binding protein|uniref:Metal ABC transporter solute-binding protein, Zn/Mn family n=1 Tax=Clostridium lapidicellarium TaxID=3240931 RepID=A0ABV4DWG9_9CLOT